MTDRKKMRTIGFKRSLEITEKESFIEFESDIPVPKDHDLLVRIAAISVNPVDFKIRQSAARNIELDPPKVIGWDAVGTVVHVGEKVTRFAPGDEVYYAGDLTRSGCNAEYQLVDERIVGMKPKQLSVSEAAAIPLTGLTAWETLFDRIGLNPEKDREKSVLILAGAGGVGSIAIQLAGKVASLRVIATASRPETAQWCLEMGADHVVDHHHLVEEMKKIGFSEVDFILDFADLRGYWDTMAQLIRPQGHIVSITGSSEPLDLNLLKSKSVTFSFEFMYTRSMYQTGDMAVQHEILNNISELLDNGTLKTTLNQTFKGFTAENLKKAHQQLETGKSIGKTVIIF